MRRLEPVMLNPSAISVFGFIGGMVYRRTGGGPLRCIVLPLSKATNGQATCWVSAIGMVRGLGGIVGGLDTG